MTAISAPAIGGSYDKRTIEATPYSGMGTRVRRRPATELWAEIEPLPGTEIYRLETFFYACRASETGESKIEQFKFWVLEGISRDDAFKMLMEGYARP